MYKKLMAFCFPRTMVLETGWKLQKECTWWISLLLASLWPAWLWPARLRKQRRHCLCQTRSGLQADRLWALCSTPCLKFYIWSLCLLNVQNVQNGMYKCPFCVQKVHSGMVYKIQPQIGLFLKTGKDWTEWLENHQWQLKGPVRRILLPGSAY